MGIIYNDLYVNINSVFRDIRYIGEPCDSYYYTCGYGVCSKNFTCQWLLPGTFNTTDKI